MANALGNPGDGWNPTKNGDELGMTFEIGFNYHILMIH